MRIYTRTGDGGETELLDGRRVSKTHPSVDACGHVDELGASLGVARAAGVDADIADILATVQRDLFSLCVQLTDPTGKNRHKTAAAAVGDADVERLERWIDNLQTELPVLRGFVLAGGTPAGAALHVARTVCRRAERHIASLIADGIEPRLLAYMNRLSDLLFVLARVVNKRAGAAETEWSASR